mmetsp:Transcript_74782/g.217071  ORF Transcript_74782/g.217071 Transcript_74782/m.217071 type:complete len:85 (+) Transcript_74782:1252-1506(+)
MFNIQFWWNIHQNNEAFIVVRGRVQGDAKLNKYSIRRRAKFLKSRLKLHCSVLSAPHIVVAYKKDSSLHKVRSEALNSPINFTN